MPSGRLIASACACESPTIATWRGSRGAVVGTTGSAACCGGRAERLTGRFDLSGLIRLIGLTRLGGGRLADLRFGLPSGVSGEDELGVGAAGRGVELLDVRVERQQPDDDRSARARAASTDSVLVRDHQKPNAPSRIGVSTYW